MNLKSLGKRIRDLREQRGMKQRDVACALQISAQAVSKWERGENAPDIAILLELSQLLDVTCDTLLGREDRVGETFPATVFCTALVNFAQDASDMAPRDVALRANGVLYQATESLLAFDGVPVKYTGDGLLGFFSGPAHATRAAEAALRAQGSSSSRDLTISLHQGEIFLGKLGHPDYARLDIIGSTVNVAYLALGWAVANAPGAVCATATLAAAIDPKIERSQVQTARLSALEGELELVCLGRRPPGATGDR